MSSCLFCGVIRREVPAEIEHEDELVIAIRDINPQAPTHLLVMPREHVGSVHQLDEAHDATWARLLHASQLLAEREGVAQGYRLVVNSGRRAGQTVDHLHLHLLGGRQMTWPPG